MTAIAKIEANQRNGVLSTGPRTAEGKAIVARNATKHGIFAAVPVLPGENPEAWEAHRAGVVESLAPVGLLEVNLAERSALLLWRLQRLARYEAETVAAAMEDVEVPPLPPPKDPVPPLFPPPQQQTREEQLRDIREQLRTAREELAEIGPARDYFLRTVLEGDAEAVVPFTVAQSILEAACSRAETAENLRADPPEFGSKKFLQKLDVTETNATKVTWTPELIRRGLAFYASCAREAPDRFRDAVGRELEQWGENLARQVQRLEREVAAVVRLLDERITRKQTAKLLSGDGRDERIAKYERHLHSLLTSTLHELERLQARREGESVPPPVVADVNVTVDDGPG
jgi:hypothetical protein